MSLIVEKALSRNDSWNWKPTS